MPAVAQAVTREIDGDTRLVKLAGSYGDCLRAKGRPVYWDEPSLIERNGRKRFQKELGKLPQEPSPEAAKPYLDGEIKASLEDLECGRDFYPAFLPKRRQIMERTLQEFGWGDGPLRW